MLKKEQDFQDEHLVDREAKEHRTITDKGFMIALEAFFHKQKVIQPTFSKNGLAFAGMEGLCVSEVASYRSGNERPSCS